MSADRGPATGAAVRIRPAGPADAPAIARLDGLSRSTRRSLGRELERAVGPDAEVVVLVAVPAGGHLAAGPADVEPAPRAAGLGGADGPATMVLGAALGQVLVDEGHVVDLAVDPAWRGQGIGRRLLTALLVGLRARGAVAATLEVRPSNRAALALYRASSFVVEGRRTGYYPDGEDALLLWRRDEDGRR
jgi:ribosomal protein S18 acetylase RimI-like enzyme